jgi:ribonuclease R
MTGLPRSRDPSSDRNSGSGAHKKQKGAKNNKTFSGKSKVKPLSETYLPTKQDILTFITENPDRAAKRDIAKAFNLKGDARIYLKDILRELADDGQVEKRAKRLSRPNSLPPIAALTITGRDSDGGLVGRPIEWSGDTAAPLVLLRRTNKDKGPTVGVGDQILAKIFANSDKGGLPYTGRVIKKLEKRDNAILGVIRQLQSGEYRLEPVNRKQTEVSIAAEFLNGAEASDLVEVIPHQKSRFGLPQGKVEQVIGSIGSEKALSMIAIHEYEIPHIFPEKAIEQAENAKPATMSHREDWRSLPLVTIDPADAKDYDDAVFAEADTDPVNPGGFVIVVAIADVSYYVQHGSALDHEAQKRGNSVYFPDRVVPMLPERISNDLCSLREGVDRPAMAVRIIIGADGRKRSHSFHRIMMRSVARLAYQQAQAAIDGALDEKTERVIDISLKPLWSAYAALKKARDKREPLELDLPEKKLILDDQGQVLKVIVPDRLDAHKLIEEFMIQANVAAAEVLEAKNQPLIYRIHDVPSLAKQESLRDFLKTLEISLARGAELRPGQFNGILSRVKGTDHEELVNQVVLRSQSQAEYNTENIGHFGLNLRHYAHFTSPIRRYADLIVHRALIRALNLGPDGLSNDEVGELPAIALNISQTERRAMLAERETTDRLIAHHLAEQVGNEFQARVQGVTKAGLFVTLATYGADGFIPISTLGREYYHYDEAGHSVAGERSGKGYRLGDSVEVRLVEAQPVAGALRFEMLTEPRLLPASLQSHHKATKFSRKTGKSRTGGPAKGKPSHTSRKSKR